MTSSLIKKTTADDGGSKNEKTATYSEVLLFEDKSDGTCALVRIGTCTDTDIYYAGTEEEWKNIYKSSSQINATVHYNCVFE